MNRKEQAVHLDPKLTWVYAVVAVRHPQHSEIDRWVPKLEQWDPQNALPHFIAAESIDCDQVIREKVPHRVEDQSPAWQNAMAAAFQSPKLDTYVDRLKELDRRVLFRYSIEDPDQAVASENRYAFPSYTAWDSYRYSKSVLESGATLETRGDSKRAVEKYWAVARFGQMLGSAGGFMMSRQLQEAYKRLGVLSEKEGKNEQAQLYAYLAEKIDQAQKKDESIFLRERFNGGDVSRWNASLVRVSGLMMLFFGLVLTCTLTVILRRQTLRLNPLRSSRLALALGLSGAVGLLLSSAMLYMSYRPYAQIFQRFIRTGDESRIRELSEFLRFTVVPLGAQGFKNRWNFVFYFWSGVTALCVIALLLVAVRHFQYRPRAKATT